MQDAREGVPEAAGPAGPAALLPWGRRTYVVGIVNCSPDSFAGDGLPDAAAAVAHGLRLAREGADVLDVGGASTRPGAAPVDAEEERRRVLPVVEALAGRVARPLSVDTTTASVAAAALRAGATVVNDVSALGADPDMAHVVREHGATVVLMDNRLAPAGAPPGWHAPRVPPTADVVPAVGAWLARRVAAARRPGSTAGASSSTPAWASGRRRRRAWPWCAAWPGCGAIPASPGCPCWWARPARGSSATCWGCRWASAWRGRWPCWPSASRPAPTPCGSTTCAPPCAAPHGGRRGAGGRRPLTGWTGRPRGQRVSRPPREQGPGVEALKGAGRDGEGGAAGQDQVGHGPAHGRGQQDALRAPARAPRRPPATRARSEER